MQVLSRYTYEVCGDATASADGMSLIYNSFADSMAQVPTALLDAIQDEDEKGIKKYPEELRLLKDEGFLANPQFDERDEVREWYEEATKTKESLDLTLVLSYRCNFACPYCFEAEFMSGVRMRPELQTDIVSWVDGLLQGTDFPTLHVTFFGGEPLIEKQTMYYLIEHLSELCKRKNRTFEFGMVTNGFHLTKELYEKLKALGLKHVKVTLDGDKERHDKSRPLKGGRGSFEVILKNLKDIGVLTSFTLGGNYDQGDPESVDSILSLLQRLKEEGIDQSIGSFGFKPLMNAETQTTKKYISCLGEGDLQGFLTIEKELRKRNLNRLRRVVNGPCEALMEHSLAIDPIGDIYPCAAFAGDKRACMGNVKTGYNKIYDEVVGYNAMDHPTCNTCTNLPGCFGGCRWAALKQKGDYSAFQCATDFFDKAVPTLLEMEAQSQNPA